ncbi:MAG: pyridoxamine 5'-phosphate oxidase [Chitinophagaceae bacterium]
MDIGNIRQDYQLKTLDESDIVKNPFGQFDIWWDEAVKSQIDEVNAMTLATATPHGIPSARIVLLKEFDERGFEFFTNYESNKGKELLANPHAALVFFWKELQRQVRIQGRVEKVEPEESDRYYNSRPYGSRIGAWSSPQSTPISSRMLLEENVARFSEQYKDEVPRPPFWGGYRLVPDLFEFWQGRSSRLHDRFQYRLLGGVWTVERLAP